MSVSLCIGTDWSAVNINCRCSSGGEKPRGHGSSSQEDAGGAGCQGASLQRETKTGPDVFPTMEVCVLDVLLKSTCVFAPHWQQEEEKRRQKIEMWENMQQGKSSKGHKLSEVSLNLFSSDSVPSKLPFGSHQHHLARSATCGTKGGNISSRPHSHQRQTLWSDAAGSGSAPHRRPRPRPSVAGFYWDIWVSCHRRENGIETSGVGQHRRWLESVNLLWELRLFHPN